MEEKISYTQDFIGVKADSLTDLSEKTTDKGVSFRPSMRKYFFTAELDGTPVNFEKNSKSEPVNEKISNCKLSNGEMLTDTRGPIDILKRIWPEWNICQKIASGAYGTVCSATRTDHNVESCAAIKIISIPSNEAELYQLSCEGLDFDASRTYLREIVNNFVNEIRLMVSLEGSPNIVNVQDYYVFEKKSEIGWYIYIRMELLTPFDVYAYNRRFSEEEVIRLGCDICTALEICEKQNIIHRDIKPGNILVHKTGVFKLGDFGIAKKLESINDGLSQKGTKNYAAPEVIAGLKYDSRVDIYSLGLVLYRLMNNNKMPFLNDKQSYSPDELATAVERRVHGENFKAPSDASPYMAEVILKACSFDPSKRFSTASEMKQALISVANGTYRFSQNGGIFNNKAIKAYDKKYDKTEPLLKR